MSKLLRRQIAIAMWLGVLVQLPLPLYAASDLTTAEVRKTQGVQALQQGDYAAASGYLETAQRLNPDDMVINYYLGMVRSQQGKFDEALILLRPALNNLTIVNPVRYEIGYIDYRQQRYPEAIANLQEVVNRDSEHLRAHYYLALSLQKMARYDEAQTQLQPVIAAAGTLAPAAAYIHIALLYQQQRFADATSAADGYAVAYPGSSFQPQVDILREKAAAASLDARKWSATLTAGMAYDSNVTVQPDELQVVDGENQDKDDWRFSLAAEGRYTLQQQGAHKVGVGMQFSDSQHTDLDRYDARRLGVLGDYRYYEKGIFAGVEYNLATSWLGGNDYLKNQSISPYLSFKPVTDQSSLIQFSWSQNDYLPESNQDEYDGSTRYLAYRHSFNREKIIYHLIGHLIGNSASSEEQSYRGGGLGGSLQFNLATTAMTTTLSFARRDYPDNRQDRSDNINTLLVKAVYPLQESLALEGLLNITDNNSNLAVNSYQREIVGVNLRWRP
ncbi:MAG: tetratricopeptide repeat protein [Gammaproteobacteria bacterium]|nr:tetratricopeptide repeat protein [Gammaproteobacteria bacterium]